MIDAARIDPITRSEAVRLATEEGRRYLDLVRSLTLGDWNRPTDCDRWNVRDIVAHTLGAAEGVVSIREMVHQFRHGKQLAAELHLPDPLDGVNELQVVERRDISPEGLVDRLATVEPRFRRARRRVRGPLRRIPMTAFGGQRITLGWLMDVIYTRDLWMHRVDIAIAAGRELELTNGHDGRIVADVVREWAHLHGQPFRLELTGPAAGIYGVDPDGPPLQLDAVEFCRTVSGRVPGQGLLKHGVLF